MASFLSSLARIVKILLMEQFRCRWWLADLRKRRGRFGCVPIHRAVSAVDLAWIETAGYRALPPTDESALAINPLYERPDGNRPLTAQDLLRVLTYLCVRFSASAI